MENILLKQTMNTPAVSMDAKSQAISISGESRPEQVKVFYTPIIRWMRDYENHVYYLLNEGSKVVITCSFDFEYFNSSSAKYIMDIILHLKELRQMGASVTVNWIYDELDDDILDAGKEFEELVELQFNFLIKQE